MKKKDLVDKIVELIDLINDFGNQIDQLKKENNEIRAKLTELEEKASKSAPVIVYEEPKVQDGFKVNTEIVEEKKVETKETINISVNKVVLEDNILEYGSIAIGKVVQESIKYANVISASSAEDKKELVNLIMGKAEVAKAEIFTITDGDLQTDMKKELIDTQVDEAIDYFKSAYGQIAE